MTMAVIAIAVFGIAVLLASAVWADRRYRQFDRLPTHFDFRGQADAMGPRKVIIWIVPLILVLTLAAVAASIILVPGEYQNGDPLVAIVLGTAGLVTAQGFIWWLLERWTARQDQS